jgi:hypothetical protein
MKRFVFLLVFFFTLPLTAQTRCSLQPLIDAEIQKEEELAINLITNQMINVLWNGYIATTSTNPQERMESVRQVLVSMGKFIQFMIRSRSVSLENEAMTKQIMKQLESEMLAKQLQVRLAAKLKTR